MRRIRPTRQIPVHINAPLTRVPKIPARRQKKVPMRVCSIVLLISPTKSQRGPLIPKDMVKKVNPTRKSEGIVESAYVPALRIMVIALILNILLSITAAP